MLKYVLQLAGAGFPLLLSATPVGAQDSALDSGDTAWVLAASALVMLMTLPGLVMFYGGLARSKAVLSVAIHCFAIACLAALLFVFVGYTLAYGNSVNGVIGGLEHLFLFGITRDALHGSIPTTVFVLFQMVFAIITPALIVGAYPERIKFTAVLIISGAWLLLVYIPICHWIWGGGWLGQLGVMDFGGGLVVHATAGVAALVIASMVGPRRGFPDHLYPPHQPGMTAIGAALLWVGWFGFNGGSQLAADGNAAMAIVTTNIGAASGAIVWSLIEWRKCGKPSLIGTVTGVIAGLAAITPASGFVGPLGALIIGALSGLACYFAVSWIKYSLNIDDSLDVFSVHGVGGIIGSLLVALLATSFWGGNGLSVESGTIKEQLGVQLIAVLVTGGWTFVVTYIIVRLTRVWVGELRVDEEEEWVGLDLSTHGERGYDLG